MTSQINFISSKIFPLGRNILIKKLISLLETKLEVFEWHHKSTLSLQNISLGKTHLDQEINLTSGNKVGCLWMTSQINFISSKIFPLGRNILIKKLISLLETKLEVFEWHQSHSNQLYLFQNISLGKKHLDQEINLSSGNKVGSLWMTSQINFISSKIFPLGRHILIKKLISLLETKLEVFEWHHKSTLSLPKYFPWEETSWSRN